MKIEIQSTSKIVSVNGVPARIWTGETALGVPVICYVTRIAVPLGRPESDYKVFETELQSHEPPSAEVQAIPLRLII